MFSLNAAALHKKAVARSPSPRGCLAGWLTRGNYRASLRKPRGLMDNGPDEEAGWLLRTRWTDGDALIRERKSDGQLTSVL